MTIPPPFCDFIEMQKGFHYAASRPLFICVPCIAYGQSVFLTCDKKTLLALSVTFNIIHAPYLWVLLLDRRLSVPQAIRMCGISTRLWKYCFGRIIRFVAKGSMFLAFSTSRNLAMWTKPCCNLVSCKAGEVTKLVVIRVLLCDICQLVVSSAVVLIFREGVKYINNINVCVGLDLYCS